MTVAFMSSAKGTIKYSMGSNIQPGQTVQSNMPTGNSLTGFTISGKVRVKNHAGTINTVDLNWNMIDTYQFKLNGHAIHDMPGTSMSQWLLVNKFHNMGNIDDTQSIDLLNASTYMTVPMFPNVKEPNAKTLCYINNGNGTRVQSMTLVLKLNKQYRIGTGANDAHDIVSASIDYQMFIGNGNVPENNDFCMAIKRNQIVVNIIGKSSIDDFASRGLLTQLYIQPVANIDSTKVDYVSYVGMEMQIAGTTFNNIYTDTNHQFATNSDFRQLFYNNMGALDPIALAQENYLLYDSGWNGEGLNPLYDGETSTKTNVGVDLTNVTTFSLLAEVESIKPASGRAQQEIIETYIQFIL